VIDFFPRGLLGRDGWGVFLAKSNSGGAGPGPPHSPSHV